MLHPPGASAQQVILKEEASITRWTGRGEGGHMIRTGATRATGAAQTFVHISGIARTSKANEAKGGEGAHAILAGATMEAPVCSEQERSLPMPHQPDLTQLCFTLEFNM
jgi:hypothetical protein|uniref:Uncharacterized protein n=1 Tax=Mus musculus TaxID=10090 RepID=Q8C4R4_MOUSE|nr:unnamed protein product [Mus musculus]